MSRLYVVRPGERISLAGVLAALGEDVRAVAEGRVFVGRNRASDPHKVLSQGDEVNVAREAKRIDIALPVLFEDHAFVAIAKPIGIPTVPGLQGARHSVVGMLAHARGIPASALIATSRLDQDVSGVVTFAKTSAAAEHIAQARSEGRLSRRYVALATKAPSTSRGEWDGAIGRHANKMLRAIGGPDAKPSRSRFTVVAGSETQSGVVMLALAPITGRTHQLRLHASHAGAPLLGDRDYGGARRIVLSSGRVISIARIALHCARVRFPAMTSGESTHDRLIEISAEIPEDLGKLWVALGGTPKAWDLALTCDV